MAISQRIQRFMEPENLRRFAKKLLYLVILYGLAFLFWALGWGAALKLYVVFAAVIMILAILLQSGRGGGLSAIGGMGGENLLGTRAATPIAKATLALGLLFIVGCMLLARMKPTETVVRLPGEQDQKETMPVPGGDAAQTEEQEEAGTAPTGQGDQTGETPPVPEEE